MSAARTLTSTVINRPLRRGVAALIGVAAVAVACSVSVGGLSAEDAARQINERYTEELGLGPLETTCNLPDDLEEGETFSCTSVTSDGREVRWIGTRTDDGADIRTANVLLPEDLRRVERIAVEALEQEAGATLGIENFDCGDETVVLGPDQTMVCTLRDPGSGALYDATLTFTDLTDVRFDVQVADRPRS